MRMFQNYSESLVVLVCTQLLLVIEFDYVLARRRLKKMEEDTLVLVADGIQDAHLSLAGEKSQLPREMGEEPLELSRSIINNGPDFETQFSNGERLVRSVMGKELRSARAKKGPRSFKKRLSERKPYRLANRKAYRKNKNNYADEPLLERHSRSLHPERGEKSHRRSIEHLPNALESLRRLGTDLNILGNELMGFHFPSYLRVLMYVVSLIL